MTDKGAERNENADFHRGKRRMEPEHRTHIPAFQFFFVVSRAKECQDHPVRTQGRFDDIGDVLFVFRIVEVGKILAGHFRMTA